MSNHSFFTSRNWLQLPDFDFQILLFIPNFPKFECVFCSILNLICSIVSILLAIKFSRLCHCGSNETLCRHFHNQNFPPSDYPVGFGWGGSFVCYNHSIIILTSTSNCRGNVFDRLFTAAGGQFLFHLCGFYTDVHVKLCLCFYLSCLEKKTLLIMW